MTSAYAVDAAVRAYVMHVQERTGAAPTLGDVAHFRELCTIALRHVPLGVPPGAKQPNATADRPEGGHGLSVDDRVRPDDDGFAADEPTRPTRPHPRPPPR